MARPSIVAGNWKMHGSSESIQQLMSELLAKPLDEVQCQIIVCPPTVFLPQVAGSAGKQIKVGAQNVSEYAQGAYTGEVSADMLHSFGCQHAIVGHSERRSIFGETSEQVAEKVTALLSHSMTPILCVGETLEERESGNTMNVVQQQLNAVAEHCGVEAFAKLVIAYEPVWAIGTGKTATPGQAQDVHAAIRSWLSERNADIAQNVSILYGGSVKADNAQELFAQPDIDGGLIGGASLKAEEFYQICRAAG